MNRLCETCNEHIHPERSYTKLACNHYFHVYCVKEYLILFEKCPRCKVDTRAGTVDYGTSVYIRQKIDDILLKGEKPNILRSSVHDMPTIELDPAKKNTFGNFVNSFKTFFGSQDTALLTFLKSEPRKTNSELQLSIYKAKDLVENHISIDQWVNMGYLISQLTYMDITEESLSYMGFSGKTFARYDASQWITLFMHLKCSISYLISSGITLQQLQNARTVDHRYSLLIQYDNPSTYNLMKNMSLSKPSIPNHVNNNNNSAYNKNTHVVYTYTNDIYDEYDELI